MKKSVTILDEALESSFKIAELIAEKYELSRY